MTNIDLVGLPPDPAHARHALIRLDTACAGRRRLQADPADTGMTAPPAYGVSPEAGTSAALWDRVGELVERSPNLSALRAHGLALFALQRLVQAGQPVPPALAYDERTATLTSLIAPSVLSRVRAACDGPLLVLKGPVVAALYPNGTRGYNDLDILVPDAEAAHAALIAAGFALVDDPEFFEFDIRYHLQPLAWESLPLMVEIHKRPNWPLGLEPPPIEELFEQAVESDVGDGVLAPSRAHQALLLAGHAWTHRPLGFLRDLIDVAVTVESVPPTELTDLARRWGASRLWATTSAAIEAVLYQRRRRTFALRLWARHLAAGRERTVLENHLERLLSPFWGLPPRRAISKSFGNVAAEIRPLDEETWRRKLTRTLQALKRAFVPRSEHERKLGQLTLHKEGGRGRTRTLAKTNSPSSSASSRPHEAPRARGPR
jgi:hypothetical protein